MKIRHLALYLMILFLPSCAMMFNKKEVEVSINSTPTGADIFIEGKHYGRTPATIRIIPKNYSVVLSKNGYGTAQIQMEAWATVRRQSGDRGRCIADALGTMLLIPFYSVQYSGYCHDFKEKSYSAVIPYFGQNAGMMGGSTMRGVGQNPSDMINYYYRK